MRIELHEIPVKEVVKNYVNNDEEGVIGYNGRLNIRPSFQREFVYKEKQRDEVIRTINNNFPLNVMYWVKNSDGTYGLLDGQQRTVSICEYVDGGFSIDYRFFHNLTDAERNQILDYKLMIYFCEGTDKERLDWFRIINIAGVKLTDQELRNATYTGQWLTESKKWFSKTNCPAYVNGEKYINGVPLRQDYLETNLKWISSKYNMEIEDYMAAHHHDTDATELWRYFNDVITWVKIIFPNWRKEMRGLEWGILYNKYEKNKYDIARLEKRIKELIDDDEVESKKGIYEFLLSGETEQKVLNLREFSDKIKIKVYERQKGVCPKCGSEKVYEFEKMEADHIVPWSRGGKTVEENCQMLCMHHNRTKSGG
jgi:hypothetical protein